jgi:hypothetical protein
MDSADQILAKLKQRGVTHAQIAGVLGVATANATKLYNAAGKTGKPRRLTYDEAVLLIKKFDLNPATESDEVGPLSLPVARLVVQYVASRLCQSQPVDESLVEDTARDVQAFSAFASRPHLRESESHVEGFFQGLRSQVRQLGRR